MVSKITEGIRICRVRSAQAEISRGEAVRRERCRKIVSLRIHTNGAISASEDRIGTNCHPRNRKGCRMLTNSSTRRDEQSGQDFQTKKYLLREVLQSEKTR